VAGAKMGGRAPMAERLTGGGPAGEGELVVALVEKVPDDERAQEDEAHRLGARESCHRSRVASATSAARGGASCVVGWRSFLPDALQRVVAAAAGLDRAVGPARQRTARSDR